MFHVKHPAPEDIADDVRARIEQFLLDIGPLPLRPGFVGKIVMFAAALALWGVRMNLTAEPEKPAEIAFHVIDSLMPFVIASRKDSPLAEAFAPGARVLDLGSGAGFPGLVLAAASDAGFRLVEARRKRASFLNAVVHEMGLANVEIDSTYRGMKDFGGNFDTVTARAFGPSVEFYKVAAQALRPGGRAILYANPEQELDAGQAEIAGLEAYERIPYEVQRGGSVARRILAVWRRR
jgi:16S rRNA (guanine527-N7)-methyltransferase